MADAARVYAGLVSVDVRIPGVRSLKEKRSVVKSLVERLRRDLRCSVAEVAYTDSYQRCALGVAVASGTVAGARTVAEQVERVVARELRVEIISAPIVIVSDDD